MPITITERVRLYLRAIGAAVAGSGESHKTVLAACLAGHDFGVDLDAFMPLLEEWNNGNQPPLDERALRTQVTSAYRSARSPFGHKLAADDAAPDAPRRDPPPPPEYPPADEVKRFWEMCMGLDEHPAASAWATSRGLSVGRLATPREFPLVRAVRRVAGPNHPSALPGARLNQPRWAAIGPDERKLTPWAETGYQVVIPCFDAAGAMRSFRARWIRPEDPVAGKAVPPRGFEARGLVMANLPGLWLLRFGAWPDSAKRGDRQLWIVEGEPDMLTVADLIRTTRDNERAVWGLYNGSWTVELSARIPDGADVVLGLHDDKAGHAYRDKVQRTLHGRVQLRQHRPKTPREDG
jgi:hypothetical protein